MAERPVVSTTMAIAKNCIFCVLKFQIITGRDSFRKLAVVYDL
jgi:hypothetical protein